MELRGTLSAGDIETFLEESTIPIRLGCRTPSGRLWMLSMWYRYVPAGSDGGVEDPEADDDADDPNIAEWSLQCATAADADVVTFLSEHPEVAFEVSTNQPPYTGVRGRGTASIESDPDKETLRDLIGRYLDGTESPLARQLLREDRDEVTITIEPAVVSGWDYSSRMGSDRE